MGFSGGSDGKEYTCNEGDPGSILGQEDPLEKRIQQSSCLKNPCVGKIHLEKGMATHSSILALRIPQTEEPGSLEASLVLQTVKNLPAMQETQV